jgi:hypothetical protein
MSEPHYERPNLIWGIAMVLMPWFVMVSWLIFLH